MNGTDILIILLIAAAVAAAVLTIRKKKKSGCGCGCEGCAVSDPEHCVSGASCGRKTMRDGS